MATITTTVSPKIQYQPYTGLPEQLRQGSGIARAEVIYYAAGSWAPPGAGNDAVINFDFTLDNNYAYVLTDINAYFYRAANSMNMEGVGRVIIKPDSTNGELLIATSVVAQPSRSDGTSTAIGSIPQDEYNSFHPEPNGYSLAYVLQEPKPTYLIYPYSSPGKGSSDIKVYFGDAEINSLTKVYYFTAKLLQYDISQGYNFNINSPIPVR